MKTALLALAVPVGLVGCAPTTMAPEDPAQAAEQVAATVVARVYPGLSTTATANCVRDHATTEELASLAGSAGNVGGAPQILTLTILDRPATDACLRANGIMLGN